MVACACPRPHPPDRLPGKALGVGLRLGEAPRAYPLEAVRTKGVIHDVLDGIPIILADADAFQSVFLCRLDGDNIATTFEFGQEKGTMTDQQAHATWSHATSLVQTCTANSPQLAPLVAPLVFWFA